VGLPEVGRRRGGVGKDKDYPELVWQVLRKIEGDGLEKHYPALKWNFAPHSLRESKDSEGGINPTKDVYRKRERREKKKESNPACSKRRLGLLAPCNPLYSR